MGTIRHDMGRISGRILKNLIKDTKSGKRNPAKPTMPLDQFMPQLGDAITEAEAVGSALDKVVEELKCRGLLK
jgi:hypothetical protein